MALNKKEKLFLKNLKKRIDNGELFSRALIDPKSASESFKKELCRKLIDYSNSNRLSVSDIARLTNIEESKIDEVFKYRVERFTTDFLVDLIYSLISEESSRLKILSSAKIIPKK